MQNVYNCNNCQYFDSCESRLSALNNPKVDYENFKNQGCFSHSSFEEEE